MAQTTLYKMKFTYIYICAQIILICLYIFKIKSQLKIIIKKLIIFLLIALYSFWGKKLYFNRICKLIFNSFHLHLLFYLYLQIVLKISIIMVSFVIDIFIWAIFLDF